MQPPQQEQPHRAEASGEVVLHYVLVVRALPIEAPLQGRLAGELGRRRGCLARQKSAGRHHELALRAHHNKHGQRRVSVGMMVEVVAVS